MNETSHAESIRAKEGLQIQLKRKGIAIYVVIVLLLIGYIAQVTEACRLSSSANKAYAW